MKWLIEKDIFGDNISNKFTEILKERNQDFKISEYIPFNEDQFFNYFQSEDSVFFYGSLNCMKRLQYQVKQDQFKSKLIDYCPWPLFRASIIYPQYKGKVVARSYIPVTVDQFLKNIGFFFKNYTVKKDEWYIKDLEGLVFCKSDEGDKRFNGDLYTEIQLKEAIENNLKCEYITKNDLLIIAKPSLIKKEYRLVISNKKIVTGSCYISNGRIVDNPNDELPLKIYNFISSLFEWYRHEPAPVYVIDVAEVESTFCGLRTLDIIETGSINVCGLYGCNIPSIVDVILKNN